ncbi:hypothetical protein QJS10_CPB18g01240 [Acorus calamus]|uniref:Uncharacterized protein n=1 Tax=Acorus calamus TaxID=4465 RepID=A0AAV9CJ52_ACOCL|nr:hypothetical protein QJS10_CPB18g01240 [Acorus calamus]
MSAPLPLPLSLSLSQNQKREMKETNNNNGVGDFHGEAGIALTRRWSSPPTPPRPSSSPSRSACHPSWRIVSSIEQEESRTPAATPTSSRSSGFKTGPRLRPPRRPIWPSRLRLKRRFFPIFRTLLSI